MKIKATGSKVAKAQSAGLSSGVPQAQPSSSSESSAESSSEDDSDDDMSVDDTDIEQKPPLPATRPTDPEKAIEYDVIKIVWSRYDKHITGDGIRAALGAYWTLFKPVRDNWKTEITAMQEAEAQDQQAKLDYHKSRSLAQRGILERAIRATVEYGHTDIVEKYVFFDYSTPQALLAHCILLCSGSYPVSCT